MNDAARNGATRNDATRNDAAPDSVAPAGVGAAEPEPHDGLRHVRAVGAIIFDEDGRLLLIRRGHVPAAGRWSVPGGKVEPGETDEQAVARELYEETGLRVRVGRLAGSVSSPGVPGTVYDIFDYDATLADLMPCDDGLAGASALGTAAPGSAASGTAVDARPARGVAASDAADLAWVHPSDLGSLPLTDGLVEALRRWGRLP